MECPVCGGRNTKVVDSRDSRDGVRRRRVCNECGHRFTTRERIDETLPMVLKRTGERQPFDRNKIRRGLDIACRKRGVPVDALERIVTQIETWASTRGDRELSAEMLGERIMHHLYALDQVAYVRFVSVYRSFETIAEFEHLLREMQKAERVDIEGQRTLFPDMVPEVGVEASLPGQARAASATPTAAATATPSEAADEAPPRARARRRKRKPRRKPSAAETGTETRTQTGTEAETASEAQSAGPGPQPSAAETQAARAAETVERSSASVPSVE